MKNWIIEDRSAGKIREIEAETLLDACRNALDWFEVAVWERDEYFEDSLKGKVPCDGSCCEDKPVGLVRVLPDGDGNILLCFDCFEHEMEFRRERNLHLDAQNKYELPTWESLKEFRP
jgi:hypothetical protein